MELLTQKIKNNFGDKFSYLKLYEVIFNKQESNVEITFLFPENVVSIPEKDKKELYDFISKTLNLSSKINIKYKKSYLDNDLILNSLLNYIKTNHFSVFSYLKSDEIKIEKNGLYIKILFELNSKLYDLYADKKLEDDIKKHLEKNFISEFYITIGKTEFELNSEDHIEEQQQKLFEKVVSKPKVARYNISNVENIFGHDIEPFPEFIKNVKEEKENIILAGNIENFEKKSYLSKKGKTKGQTKFYYAFDLNDTTSKIEVRYFTTKSNEEKMDKLFNGGQVAIVGDVREFAKKFTLYVNSISYCTLPEKIEYKQEFKKDYELIFPQPYSIIKQQNLFITEQKLPEEILNTSYVVFDTETTGLDHEHDEIIEIGAVKIVNGNICESFQTLIKPKQPIPAEATAINNITNKMVEDAPSADVAIRDFYRWTRGTTLVGYNVGFDLKFIQQAAKNVGLSFNNNNVDALVLAKNKLRLSRYKLTDVVKRLDITLDNAHRALADSIATAQVFINLNYE